MRKLRSSLSAASAALLLSLGTAVSCRDSVVAPDNARHVPAARHSNVVATAPTFVQANAGSVAGQSITVPLTSSTNAGNLVVVAFDYTGTSFASITDSQGNQFQQAGAEVTTPGGAATRMYYAKNVKGGAESVTVSLAGATSSLEVYVAEYRGVDPVAPLDASSQATGTATDDKRDFTSGTLTPTTSNDILVGFCVSDNFCGADEGFNVRNDLHSNLLEDEQIGAAGTPVAATGYAGAGWAVVAAAFRPVVPVASVLVTPQTAGIQIGQTRQFTATTLDPDGHVLTGHSVTWSSSNTAVATVNATSGLVSGVSAGNVTITATSDGVSGSASVAITLPSAPGSFVQDTAREAQRTATGTIPFQVPTTQGDLLVAAFDYDATANFTSITDSQGNTWTQAATEQTSPGGAKIRMFYAQNVKGGPDAITVNLSSPVQALEIYIAEYHGIDPVAPLDGAASAAGGPTIVSSGTITTSTPNDLLVAYCVGDNDCELGSGFRVRSRFDLNLLEDRITGAPGSYTATGTSLAGWAIVGAAFKPQAPVASVTISPAAAKIVIGLAQQLTATTKDGNGNVLTGRAVTWSSTNTAVATVSSTGLVTAVAPGSATISATSEGQSGSASMTVVVPAPPQFVQAHAIRAVGGSTSVALDSLTGAGNLLIVALDYTGTDFASITDSQGNTFTQIGDEITTPGGVTTRMYFANNIKGGAESISVKLAGSTTSLEVYAVEYSGADPVNPFDAAGSATGTGSDPVTSGPLTTQFNSDLLVAYCVGDTFCTPGSGFTPRLTLDDNLFEERALGDAGIVQATGSAGSGWGIIAAAIRPLGAVQATPVPFSRAAVKR